MILASVALVASLYGDIPNAKHAWAVHDYNRPKPAKVTPAPYVKSGAPSDAIVLFDGTKASLEKNWCAGDGKPTQWKLGKEGDFYCLPGWKNGGNIQTRSEFGDCQLHIEYRHEADVNDQGRGPQMRGNSGVFLMGTDEGYEVQVLESFYTSRELEGQEGFVDNYADGQAGAVYAENPPMVNPQRKPGEWQTYDIVFHQPVWKDGTLLHPGSLTVFFNGVLVQDHWEMEGQTTHCKRRPLAPPSKTKGPLALQDHGCTVHFRNIWLRPLPSRWDNLTHSEMSADPAEVIMLRHETADRLFSKIDDPEDGTVKTLLALAEVVSYAYEDRFSALFGRALEAYRANPGDKAEVEQVNNQLKVLVRGGILTEEKLIQ